MSSAQASPASHSREALVRMETDMQDKTKYYIIQIECYEGDETSLFFMPHQYPHPAVKAVFAVGEWQRDGMLLKAGGYFTKEELLSKWPDTHFENRNQTFDKSSLGTVVARHILEIESDSNIWVNCQCCADTDGETTMYCVLFVYQNGVAIMDYGYSSVEQLLTAWKNEKFEGIKTP